MHGLKQRGMEDRIANNRIARISALLKANGVTGLLSTSNKPRYEEKDVEAYTSAQLGTLFAEADRDERQLFEFFLATGFREQEAIFTTWKNIDFKSRVIAVRSRPELGVKIKDKEEHSVPVPDSVVASLMERKSGSCTISVFPGKNGTANERFLVS